MFFFLKKNILIPNVAEKNILILVEGKKKYDSASCDKKKNILTLVLSAKKFLNETKNHNLPSS